MVFAVRGRRVAHVLPGRRIVAQECGIALGQGRNAFSVRAESSRGRPKRQGAASAGPSGAGWAAAWFAGGGSSRTTCALLPPKPNALTPAMRGCVVSGQGSSVCCTRSGKLLKGMSGLGVRKCKFGGNWRCFSAKATLIRLAIPEAASVWPMLVFTEPIAQGRSGGRPSRRTLPKASASMMSPSRVPVPWASTNCTWAGETLARA